MAKFAPLELAKCLLFLPMFLTITHTYLNGKHMALKIFYALLIVDDNDALSCGISEVES